MKIPQPETPAMLAGREAHTVVTNHVCGIKKDDRVPLDLEFQTPEYKVFADYRSPWALYGFIDAVSHKSQTIMEYKTSTQPWSQAKFDKLMQIPFYSLATGFRKVFMVTSTGDLQNFKTFYKVVSDTEIAAVTQWIDRAIEKIEVGDFYGDLDGNRKCNGDCPYGPNCMFI